MRLSTLLAHLSPDDLERMTAEHLRGEVRGNHAELCHVLEGILRSYAFVQRFVIDRQPPAFALLVALLEADGHRVVASELRERAAQETTRIVASIESGTILQRDDGLRVYRRVLAEARRNGLDLDAHEAAILAVLRAELSVRLVEHYLIGHHPDLMAFWSTDHAFLHEVNAMRSVGLVFAHEGAVVLAEDVAPMVRQALDLELSRNDARRMYATLGNSELGAALEKQGLRSVGNKEVRIDRLVDNWVAPRDVLGALDVSELRERVKDLELKSSGLKQDLIERLLAHYGNDRDLVEAEEPPPPPAEPKMLPQDRFEVLFGRMSGHELSELLREIDATRITGSKLQKIGVLWASPLSESTLLSRVPSRTLESLLDGLRLRITGTKAERTLRLIEWARTVPDLASLASDLLDPVLAGDR